MSQILTNLDALTRDFEKRTPSFIAKQSEDPVTIHFSSARVVVCKQKIVPMKCQTNDPYLSLKHLKSDSK